ncbi:hypothetical protein E4T39_05032 [Aureobasidium subglaciale]|nr:hypothetical protein E4T39_05032 [Aureobasidium subglaciale]
MFKKGRVKRNIPAENHLIQAGGSPRRVNEMTRDTFTRVYSEFLTTGTVPEEARSNGNGNSDGQQPEDDPGNPENGNHTPAQRIAANQRGRRARPHPGQDRMARFRVLIEETADERPNPPHTIERRIPHLRGRNREEFLRASTSVQDFILEEQSHNVQTELLRTFGIERRRLMGDVGSQLPRHQQQYFQNLPTLGEIRRLVAMTAEERSRTIDQQIRSAEERRQRDDAARDEIQREQDQAEQEREQAHERELEQHRQLELQQRGLQPPSQEQVLHYQYQNRLFRSLPDLMQRLRHLRPDWLHTLITVGPVMQDEFFRLPPHEYENAIGVIRRRLAGYSQRMVHLCPFHQRILQGEFIYEQHRTLELNQADQFSRVEFRAMNFWLCWTTAMLEQQGNDRQLHPIQQVLQVQPQPPPQHQPAQQQQQQQQNGLQQQHEEYHQLLREALARHLRAGLQPPTQEQILDFQQQSRLARSIPDLEQRTSGLDEDWRLTLTLIDPVWQERFFEFDCQEQEFRIRRAQQDLIELNQRMAHLPLQFQHILQGEFVDEQVRILGLSPEDQLLWLKIRSMGFWLSWVTASLEQQGNNGQDQSAQQAPQDPDEAPQAPEQASRPPQQTHQTPQQAPQPPSQPLQQEQEQHHPDDTIVDTHRPVTSTQRTPFEQRDISGPELRAMREAGWGPQDYDQWVEEDGQARWIARCEEEKVPRE